MFKLVVLYRDPESVVEFDAKYAEHMELIAKVPGLQKTEVGRFVDAPWGAADLLQVAELYFADKEALDAAMQSPEMAVAGKQLRSFAKGLFTMYYAQVS